jgi:hypothetical protein
LLELLPVESMRVTRMMFILQKNLRTIVEDKIRNLYI